MNRNRTFRALLSLALLIVAAASAMAQGRIEVVGGDTHDWGTVAPGDLRTTVVVRNAGTGVLNIARVQPACGCTSSPIDKNVLQPGETGSIAIKVTANGTGPIRKVVTIYSDAPGDTAHVISLVASLQAPQPIHSSTLTPATSSRAEAKKEE